jgi:peptidoglycan/xylan/chitin deacetylase (PgdA/CDA1 family)
MVVGPVLYRAPRPGRHRRRRTATLVLLLVLLAAAAMVAVRPWTALHHSAAIRTAASTRPARSRPTARGSLPVTAPAVVSCPPAASIRGRPGRPVGGAGRRTPPAAVRHSPWVSYHLPVAREAGKTVALTFDDGPDPRYTPRVLAVLARARTPAAFFMVGRQAAAHPQLVRRVAQAGQQVDGHTWNHLVLDRLPPAQVAAEVDCTNRLLARLAGRPVRLLRPPDGAYDKTVVNLLATRRLQLILWTVDSRDWAHPGVRRILATVARELRPGAIILLHDGGGDRSQTVAALPALLRQLHARGYRAVALPPVQRGRPNGQAGRRPGRSRCGRCGWRMWCCKRTVTAVR